MGAAREGAGAAVHALSIPCSKTPHLRCTTLPSAPRTHGDGDGGYFLLTLSGSGQFGLFSLSLFFSANICLHLPNLQGWRMLGDFPPQRTDTISLGLFAVGSGCAVFGGKERHLLAQPTAV